MRPLTEEETTALFEKLANYVGPNLKHLIEAKNGPTYVFRYHKDRVYYMSEQVLNEVEKAGRDEILCAGTCFGKITKTGKVRLNVTALDWIAKLAQYKVWVKPSSEMSYLYGNHVTKAGLGKITAGTPRYQGVVVMSMGGVPLGFGVAAQPTEACSKVDPSTIIVFNQTDIGEYLRDEDIL